jgi:hypothetical protein
MNMFLLALASITTLYSSSTRESGIDPVDPESI